MLTRNKGSRIRETIGNAREPSGLPILSLDAVSSLLRRFLCDGAERRQREERWTVQITGGEGERED